MRKRAIGQGMKRFCKELVPGSCSEACFIRNLSTVSVITSINYLLVPLHFNSSRPPTN